MINLDLPSGTGLEKVILQYQISKMVSTTFLTITSIFLVAMAKRDNETPHAPRTVLSDKKDVAGHNPGRPSSYIIISKQ